MVLTGRECAATQRRMEELKVDYLYQNVRNKKEFLTEFIEKRKEKELPKEENRKVSLCRYYIMSASSVLSSCVSRFDMKQMMICQWQPLLIWERNI